MQRLAVKLLPPKRAPLLSSKKVLALLAAGSSTLSRKLVLAVGDQQEPAEQSRKEKRSSHACAGRGAAEARTPSTTARGTTADAIFILRRFEKTNLNTCHA